MPRLAVPFAQALAAARRAARREQREVPVAPASRPGRYGIRPTSRRRAVVIVSPDGSVRPA